MPSFVNSPTPLSRRSVYQSQTGCKEIERLGCERLMRVSRQGQSSGHTIFAVLLVCLECVLPGRYAWSAYGESGSCRVISSDDGKAGRPFVRHLAKDCSEEERVAQAITAPQIMNALVKGRGVDLSGVIVTGDLFLDELPMRSSTQVRASLKSDEQQALGESDTNDLRLIAGTFSIRDSEVRGRILNRVKDDRLVISGPFILSGTRFQEAVDLSRTVFLGVVDCSSASFSKESFFVQSHFVQPAMFTQASFGPHTRFHRSKFNGAANFYRARFNGLAELLEVSFSAGAVFTESTFLSGTGFSGSRFAGMADFLEAEFRGDVYFLFSQFEQGTRFRGAKFLQIADFSEAAFPMGQDLTQAVFAKRPRLPASLQSSMPQEMPSPNWMVQYGVTLALLLLSLVLVVVLFKIK